MVGALRGRRSLAAALACAGLVLVLAAVATDVTGAGGSSVFGWRQVLLVVVGLGLLGAGVLGLTGAVGAALLAVGAVAWPTVLWAGRPDPAAPEGYDRPAILLAEIAVAAAVAGVVLLLRDRRTPARGVGAHSR